MEASSVSVSVEASTEQLKSDLSESIQTMLTDCNILKWRHWVCRCNVLAVSLVVVLLIPLTVGLFCGPDIGGYTAAGSVSLFLLALYCFTCKLPWSNSLVRDLKKHSHQLLQSSELLKQRVKDEVWLRSMSSRWRCVEDLQKTSADVGGVVGTLETVVNAYLVSDLSKKLKACQKLLRNI